MKTAYRRFGDHACYPDVRPLYLRFGAISLDSRRRWLKVVSQRKKHDPQMFSPLYLDICLRSHSLCSTSESGAGRWNVQRANDWYAKQPWLVGANFIPSDAINELEMFQAETFNPKLIDKELGMGESIGMNTMRVFLQDQLWKQDPKGFTGRLNTFLCDCGEAPHTAAAGAVRLVLGDESAPGTAASADSRSTQLRLGAEPRERTAD